jgi:ABC-type transport system involved in cytochrome c biogenesis permease component
VSSSFLVNGLLIATSLLFSRRAERADTRSQRDNAHMLHFFSIYLQLLPIAILSGAALIQRIGFDGVIATRWVACILAGSSGLVLSGLALRARRACGKTRT